MAHASELIATDIMSYLDAQEHKGFLRFITCGSVDDGKSTLIGRLLYDSKMIFEDQLSALEADSKKVGTTGGDIDLALLVDGLAAEREQGITIDVAYRFFSTDKRKFIVADTPGHEQYTRNMATGASTAELAVILIDARKGILTQTRRHSYIVSLLGIRHVVLAINKMDLVDYSETIFDEIRESYATFSKDLNFSDITAIPMSALKGDNILNRSESTPWYDGTTLMSHLESVDVDRDDQSKPFRLPVQWVNRPNLDFRGFSGTIVGGGVKVGDPIIALPSGKKSEVASILIGDEESTDAVAGEAVTLTLTDEIDISRGDILCSTDHPARVSDQFMGHILWMHEDALLPGRPYILKSGNKTSTAVITSLKHKVNVNSLEHQSGKTLKLNEVGQCNISLNQQIAFDPYTENRDTGGFVLIDRLTNDTVGAGMFDYELRRASNIVWQDLDVDKQTRSNQKHQKPCVLWFTGLSGSGKSTVANLVEKKLLTRGKHTYILDGDNVRHGLNKDLGFTDVDRVENIRRVGETARLFVDSGLIVLVSFISPFASERRMARNLLGEGEFMEVFVDTPLEICERRDTKGLYKKARDGKIKNFTGIDSAYEAPESAEIVVKTDTQDPEDSADQIIAYLEESGYLESDG
jgi:bifunctional enzyme CysN/CysC